MLTNPDTVNLIGDLNWASVENGLALICACLPTYRPLLSKGQAVLLSLNTWYSSLLSTRSRHEKQATPDSPSGSAQAGGAIDRKRYNQSHDGTQDHFRLTESTGTSAVDHMVAGKDYPLNTISVNSTVEVV